MERPFQYTIICQKSGAITQTNVEPSLDRLQTWEDAGNGAFVLKQTKTCYIDTRYEAKLRLWKYINYTKKGLEIPRYKPFENPEIGKTIPILNF
jgi:hypothetical protein